MENNTGIAQGKRSRVKIEMQSDESIQSIAAFQQERVQYHNPQMQLTQYLFKSDANDSQFTDSLQNNQNTQNIKELFTNNKSDRDIFYFKERNNCQSTDPKDLIFRSIDSQEISIDQINQKQESLRSKNSYNNIDDNNYVINNKNDITNEKKWLDQVQQVDSERMSQDFCLKKHKGKQSVEIKNMMVQKKKMEVVNLEYDIEVDKLINQLQEEIKQQSQISHNNQQINDIQDDDVNNPEVECDEQIAAAVARNNKKHNSYNMSSVQQKELFLLYCVKGYTPDEAAEECGVTIKCAKRWIQNLSADRLKGGGRKIVDPMLEQKLRLWICLRLYQDMKVPSREEQIKYSIATSNDASFKASKGWLEKYLDRNQLKMVLSYLRNLSTIQFTDIAQYFIVIPDRETPLLRELQFKLKQKSKNGQNKTKQISMSEINSNCLSNRDSQNSKKYLTDSEQSHYLDGQQYYNKEEEVEDYYKRNGLCYKQQGEYTLRNGQDLMYNRQYYQKSGEEKRENEQQQRNDEHRMQIEVSELKTLSQSVQDDLIVDVNKVNFQKIIKGMDLRMLQVFVDYKKQEQQLQTIANNTTDATVSNQETNQNQPLSNQYTSFNTDCNRSQSNHNLEPINKNEQNNKFEFNNNLLKVGQSLQNYYRIEYEKQERAQNQFEFKDMSNYLKIIEKANKYKQYCSKVQEEKKVKPFEVNQTTLTKRGKPRKYKQQCENSLLQQQSKQQQQQQLLSKNESNLQDGSLPFNDQPEEMQIEQIGNQCQRKQKSNSEGDSPCSSYWDSDSHCQVKKTKDKTNNEERIPIETKKVLSDNVRQILRYNILYERKNKVGMQAKPAYPTNQDIIYEIELTHFIDVTTNTLNFNYDQLLKVFKFQF